MNNHQLNFESVVENSKACNIILLNNYFILKNFFRSKYTGNNVLSICQLSLLVKIVNLKNTTEIFIFLLYF